MYYDHHNTSTKVSSTTDEYKGYFKLLLEKGHDGIKLQARQPQLFADVYTTPTQLPHVSTNIDAQASSSSTSQVEAVKPNKAQWEAGLALAKEAIDHDDSNKKLPALRRALGPVYTAALVDYFRPARLLYWNWTNMLCELAIMNAVERLILGCIIPLPVSKENTGAPVITVDLDYNISTQAWEQLQSRVLNRLNNMLIRLNAIRDTQDPLPFIGVTLLENVRTDALNKLVFYITKTQNNWKNFPPIPLYEILYFLDKTRTNIESACEIQEEKQQTLYREKYQSIPVDTIWKTFQTDLDLEDAEVTTLRNSGIASQPIGLGNIDLGDDLKAGLLAYAIGEYTNVTNQDEDKKAAILSIIKYLIQRGARILPEESELLYQQFELLTLALTFADMPSPKREQQRQNYLEIVEGLHARHSASYTGFFSWLTAQMHDQTVINARTREIAALLYNAVQPLSAVSEASLLQTTAEIKAKTSFEAVKILSFTLYTYDSRLYAEIDEIQKRFHAPPVPALLTNGPGNSTGSHNNTTSAAQGMGFSGLGFLTGAASSTATREEQELHPSSINRNIQPEGTDPYGIDVVYDNNIVTKQSLLSNDMFKKK